MLGSPVERMVPKKGEFSSFPYKFDDILFGGVL